MDISETAINVRELNVKCFQIVYVCKSTENM